MKAEGRPQEPGPVVTPLFYSADGPASSSPLRSSGEESKCHSLQCPRGSWSPGSCRDTIGKAGARVTLLSLRKEGGCWPLHSYLQAGTHPSLGTSHPSCLFPNCKQLWLNVPVTQAFFNCYFYLRGDIIKTLENRKS